MDRATGKKASFTTVSLRKLLALTLVADVRHPCRDARKAKSQKSQIVDACCGRRRTSYHVTELSNHVKSVLICDIPRWNRTLVFYDMAQ